MTSNSVLSGESKPPKVRESGKRKASTAGEGREIPLVNNFPSFSDLNQSTFLSAASSASSFDTPRASSSGSTWSTKAQPLRQSNLKSSFAITTPLSPIRQAEIDWLLLRLVVCCAISFAILDNMFFFDFCYALYLFPYSSFASSSHVILVDALHILYLTVLTSSPPISLPKLSMFLNKYGSSCYRLRTLACHLMVGLAKNTMKSTLSMLPPPSTDHSLLTVSSFLGSPPRLIICLSSSLKYVTLSGFYFIHLTRTCFIRLLNAMLLLASRSWSPTQREM